MPIFGGVGASFSVIDAFQLVLSCSQKYLCYGEELQDKLAKLGRKAVTLRVQLMYTEESIALQLAQRFQHSARPDVVRWSQQAKEVSRRIDEFNGKVGANWTSCFGRLSYYKLFREADALLTEATNLNEESGKFDDLVSPIAAEFVVPSVTASTDHIIGQGETLKTIRTKIDDKSVRIIGICGTSGVGKTTLMGAIKHEVAYKEVRSHRVLWADASTKNRSLIELQRELVKKLDLPPTGLSLSENLDNYLRKTKFLLFIDNLWNRIDLNAAGIPLHENGKLIFTTQSKDICTEMGCKDIIEVNFLNEQDSWNLFCKNAGTDVLHLQPSIMPLAQAIVSQCGGLPLALIIVGQSMSQVNEYQGWLDAKDQLQEAPGDFSHVEARVLRNLKFSFEKLEDDVLRSCLLYCALFPQDSYIDKEELIDYYIGEGLLDNVHCQMTDIDVAYRIGRAAITKLQQACLVEKVTPDGFGNECIKMPFWVREMALWLTSKEPGQRNNFLVPRRNRDLIPSDMWEVATKISLIGTQVEIPAGSKPLTENLETLILGNCPQHTLQSLLTSLPSHYDDVESTSLSHMEKQRQPLNSGHYLLRVLDMSSYNISSVPEQICIFRKLQYLNLSRTEIRALPDVVGVLTKLRILNLRYTDRLEEISPGTISKLHHLQKLDLWQSGYCCSETVPDLLSVLEKLLFFRDLRISDFYFSVTPQLASGKLCCATRWLSIIGAIEEAQYLSHLVANLYELRTLIMQKVRIHDDRGNLFTLGKALHLQHLCLEQVELSRIQVEGQLTLPALRVVIICDCRNLRCLSFVAQLPNLEKISISNCHDLLYLFDDEDIKEEIHGKRYILVSLKALELHNLGSLQFICPSNPDFTSLSYIEVVGCRSLSRLPFRKGNAENIRKIRGEQQWWDQLQEKPAGHEACFVPLPK